MKVRKIHIGLALIFLFLLTFPQLVKEGALTGLSHWARTVIPVLFPFILASNLFVSLGMASGKWYAVLLGFLCGYPMGAKAAADLVRRDAVTREQGQWLMCCCNLPSPMFLTGFVQIPAVTLAVYLPALLLLLPVFFFQPPGQTDGRLSAASVSGSFRFAASLSRQDRAENDRQNPFHPSSSRKVPATAPQAEQAPGFQQLLEQAMEQSVKLMIKIGIYIMIFSILSVCIQKITILDPFLRTLLLGLNEMTIGISAARNMGFSPARQAILCTVFTAFGGLSGLSQTKSVTEGAGLSMNHYLCVRLIHVLISLGIVYLLN